jgi:hypothetical protein
MKKRFISKVVGIEKGLKRIFSSPSQASGRDGVSEGVSEGMREGVVDEALESLVAANRKEMLLSSQGSEMRYFIAMKQKQKLQQFVSFLDFLCVLKA